MHEIPTVPELLGLSDGAEVRLVRRHEIGQAPPEGAMSRTLLAALSLAGAWRPAFPDHEDLQVYAFRDSPGYLAVADAAVRGVHCGTAVAADGLAGFDTRTQRVLFRLEDDEGRSWAVHAGDGALELYELDAVDPRMDLEPPAPPPPSLPAPDVAIWSAASSAESWLAEEAADLADAPGDVERAAAAGLLARLWEPADGVANATSPREHVRAWARSLSIEAITRLEVEAVRRAQSLCDRLSVPPEPSPVAVEAIVLERDDLQSVRRVLRLVGRGQELDAALAVVDRAAELGMSRLTGKLPDLDEDAHASRWIAVASQEPNAWWAGSE
jgi:hypothetical protein